MSTGQSFLVIVAELAAPLDVANSNGSAAGLPKPQGSIASRPGAPSDIDLRR
jgi:hypothetical protein